MTRKPNSASEYLLDVTPRYVDDRVIAMIYDLTQFFPASQHPNRKAHLRRVSHIVKGKHSVIYICDFYGILTPEKAVNLAVAWYEGRTTNETD